MARFMTVVLCATLFAPEIFAQSSPPASPSEGWRVRLIPYLWGPDFEGRVGIGDRMADVDASFLDIIRELNFGFMGTVEANRNRFSTLTDFIYLTLSDKHATPGPLFSGAKVSTKPFLLTSEGGFRVAGSDESYVDVLGGIRFWHIKSELDFDPGAVVSGLDVSDSRSWVDGIFALKGKVRISPKWYLVGYGDIGGGGSNLTYQILGAAGVDLGRRYALVLGYRHLQVNYNKDRFLFNTGMGGPVIGFAIKL
jgi:hypothetical protein